MEETKTQGLMGKLVTSDKKYPLILARHGNTALNEDGDKIRGWRDVPLSEKGEQEAKELGKRLKDKQIDAIISSDLTRAKQTAESISKETGVPIIAFTKGLRPWNAGIFTGVESNKVLSKLDEYIKNPDKQIPEGESFNDFKNRYLDEINHIKRMFPDKLILAVAHHRNNVTLDAWLKAGERPDYQIDPSAMQEKGIPPADFKQYTI